jgi:tetratricopeptide (TPR) repeat protein
MRDYDWTIGLLPFLEFCSGHHIRSVYLVPRVHNMFPPCIHRILSHGLLQVTSSIILGNRWPIKSLEQIFFHSQYSAMSLQNLVTIHKDNFPFYSSKNIAYLAKQSPSHEALVENNKLYHEEFQNILALAFSFCECEQWKSALKCFNYAIRIDPFHHKLRYNRACVLLRCDNIDSAQIDVDYLIQLYPIWTNCYILSSIISYLKGNFREANSAIDNAVEYDAHEKKHNDDITRLRSLYQYQLKRQANTRVLKLKMEKYSKLILFYDDSTWNDILNETASIGVFEMSINTSQGKEYVVDSQEKWELYRDASTSTMSNMVSIDIADNRLAKIRPIQYEIVMVGFDGHSIFFNENTQWSHFAAIMKLKGATSIEISEFSDQLTPYTLEGESGMKGLQKWIAAKKREGLCGVYWANNCPINNNIIPELITFDGIGMSQSSFYKMTTSIYNPKNPKDLMVQSGHMRKSFGLQSFHEN